MHQAQPSTTRGQSQADAETPQHESLQSATFIGLLVTQFLGAANDNILRWLVIGIGKEYFDKPHTSAVLAVGSGCLVLPYLILAAPAGYLADRFSKREVIVRCKVAEIAIMALAIAAILIGKPFFMFVVVAMIGCQAALFGPAKLGSIPEMLSPSKISAANGLIGLTTVIATVVGTGVGNWLSTEKVTGLYGRERWWISAMVLLGVAISGWIASLFIMPLPAADPGRPFPRDFAKQTLRD